MASCPLHRVFRAAVCASALLVVVGASLVARPAAALTRCEALGRAQSWVDEQVAYSQSTQHANAFGSYRQDCSGFVSMAWALDKSYTAWSLQEVSTRLGSFDELQPGDAVNLPGTHVFLFKEWQVPGVSFRAYEQQTWGTVTSVTEWKVSWASSQGYGPYRLNGIRECCQPGCDGNRVVGASCGVQQDCAAAGGRCVDDALGPRCVSARCPDRGSQHICVDAQIIGQCVDGQLTTSGSCGGDSSCSAAGDAGARCVSAVCMGNEQQALAAHDVCLADGLLGHCNAEGVLAEAQACPAGQVCRVTGSSAHCATPAGPPTATVPEGSSLATAGAAPREPSSVVGGCSTLPTRGAPPPTSLLALLLGSLVRRRRRPHN